MRTPGSLYATPPVTEKAVPVYVYGRKTLFTESLCHIWQPCGPVYGEPVSGHPLPASPFALVWDIDREEQLEAQLRDVSARFPCARIILLGSFCHTDFIRCLFRVGAHVYIHKDHSHRQLLRELEWITSPAYEPVFRPFSAEASAMFTGRELELMKWIASGMTEQEIADRLFISILTVKSHKKNLFLKTGSKNVASLVKFILENGFHIL